MEEDYVYLKDLDLLFLMGVFLFCHEDHATLFPLSLGVTVL